MKMLMSVMLGIVVMALYGIAEQKFSGKRVVRFNTNALEDENPIRIRFSELNWSGWATGTIVGAIVALANYLVTKFAPLALVWFALLLALYVYLIITWRMRGRTILGLLAFVAIAVLMSSTTTASAYMTAELFNVEQNGIAERILLLVPKLTVIITVASFILDMIFFQSFKKLAEEDEEAVSQGRVLRWIGRAVALVTVLALLGTSLNAFGVNFNKPSWIVEASDSQDEESEAAEEVKPFYAFYNLPLSKNDDPANDYNFGPNPRFYHPDWEKAENAAELFDENFRERMRGTDTKGADVALAAADMAWLDANVGTRYLGTFYESCKENWAETMNAAKVAFMNDEELYYRRLNAYFTFLDHAIEVKVIEAVDMDDQIYMNPFTEDGVPDIVVFESNDHTGLFLVYVFEIKGERVEVAYRIDCGYQPTNVEKIMNITPQPNPNPPVPPENKTPDPPEDEDTPEPNPGPGPGPGPGPQPEPEPEPEPKKDKTKGTQGEPVAPNDNPGPGENTNDDNGGDTSTADDGTGSGSKTYEEYQQELKEAEDANKTTKEGGESNNPSTSTSEVNQQLGKPEGEAVTIDNNATTGTSTAAPIDEPTPVTPAATISPQDGGGQITGVGGDWGGLDD